MIPAHLSSRASDAYAQLTARERRLVVVLVFALVVTFVAVLTWLSANAIDRQQKRLRELESNLLQLDAREAELTAATLAAEQANSRVRSNNTQLFSLIQKSASDIGIQLGDLNENRAPTKDANVEAVSVDVTLRDLSLDRLHALIEKLEGKRRDGVVKVTKLKTKQTSKEPDLLDVTLTVTTWRSTGRAGAGAATGQAGTPPSAPKTEGATP